MIASTRESRFSLTTGTSLSIPTNVSRLQCPACSRIIFDDGAILRCPNGCASLLQSIYPGTPMTTKNSSWNMRRYGRMLPGNGTCAAVPLSEIANPPWLARHFNLPNLHVAFSGDYPARDVTFPSGSFKDFEAAAVLARLRLRPGDTLVLASAGNTALAFAAAAASAGRMCVIVLPEPAFLQMRFTEPVPHNVRFVVVADGSYDDAIRLSQRIAACEGYLLEGGVRNTARRDGMGIVLYRAYEAIGRMPDLYVQGVGSCAGPLAIIEAARRLQQDDPALRLPALLLAQNMPFTPLVAAWRRSMRAFPAQSLDIARSLTAKIDAAVLANNAPPYADAGGIADMLHATPSAVHAISNAEIAEMSALFYKHERILVDPAAACATAALRYVTPADRDADILLHVTGSRSLRRITYAAPENAKIVIGRDADDASVVKLAERLRAER